MSVGLYRPLCEALCGEHCHPEKDHQEEDQSVPSWPRAILQWNFPLLHEPNRTLTTGNSIGCLCNQNLSTWFKNIGNLLINVQMFDSNMPCKIIQDIVCSECWIVNKYESKLHVSCVCFAAFYKRKLDFLSFLLQFTEICYFFAGMSQKKRIKYTEVPSFYVEKWGKDIARV